MHSASLAAEPAPQPALETSTEPRVDSAACSSADQRIITQGPIVGRPESVEVATLAVTIGDQRAGIIHTYIMRFVMRLYVTLSPWHCERRVSREVSTPVLLMQMSLAMGQQKVLLHQWCRLQRIRVLG